MSSDSTLDRVDEIVADVLQIDVEEFDDDTDLQDDVDAESLDYVEIAETIEFDVGVEIPDEDLEEIDTVGGLKRYVDERT